MSQTQVERLFIADKEKIMAETWRLHTSLQTSGGDNILTSNLERADTNIIDGQLNAGMTESSGVFTFPKTGFYQVTFSIYFYSDGQGESNYIGGQIMVTTDNSNYSISAIGYENVVASNDHAHLTIIQIIDVTDTSNVKVKFNVPTDADVTAIGHSSQNRTCMTFNYLGDT
jgi:hypothetical protein